MATGATETLELTLPTEMVQRVRNTALETRRRVDDVVAEAIDQTVTPDLPQIQREVQALISYLTALPDDELKRRAENRLSKHEEGRLSRLLSANGERDLTQVEQEELDRIMEKVQILSTEEVAARTILKRRQANER